MKKAKQKNSTHNVTYALERLFTDQERDWVIETIAPVLAWIPGKSKRKSQQPFSFPVEYTNNEKRVDLVLDLMWNTRALEKLIPGVIDQAERFRSGRTSQREHVTELAAYGISFVAISALMPGTRIKSMRQWAPPDLLFDVTPNALRGVETAGRSTGGRTALMKIRNGVPGTRKKKGSPGKREQLLARPDIAEVHLSLWCASRRVGIMEQVKP